MKILYIFASLNQGTQSLRTIKLNNFFVVILVLFLPRSL